uniref:Hes2 n=1 Tax=Terebratalia transversa TaxID=34513 RepID=A0A1S6PRU5_TERTR|nr:Hes2 [Terebratalia transversa]
MERASSTLACSAAQARRNNKPIVEKRRRERINRCLTELKSLLVDNKRDMTTYNKLEKADILEMTVRHLRKLQRTSASASYDPDTAIKYRSGYKQCAEEVTRFLQSARDVDVNVKSRLIHHLTSSLQKPSSPTVTSTPVQQALQIHIPNSPNATSVNTLPGATGQTLLMPVVQNISQHQTPVQAVQQVANTQNQQYAQVTSPSGVYLIPSHMANGQVAFMMSQSPVLMNVNTPAVAIVQSPVQNNTNVQTSPVLANDNMFKGLNIDNSCYAQTKLNFDMKMSPSENVWRPW